MEVLHVLRCLHHTYIMDVLHVLRCLHHTYITEVLHVLRCLHHTYIMEVLHVLCCCVRQEGGIVGELVLDLKGDDGSTVRSLQGD